jgi:phenylalanyl-tRNA synthetase beta chain
MKISVEWLKNYVTFSLPPEKLAHRLTLAGHEVEHIETVDGDTVMDLEVTPTARTA